MPMKKTSRSEKNRRRRDKASPNRHPALLLAVGIALAVGAVMMVLAKRENAVPRQAGVERSPRPTVKAKSSMRIPPFHNDVDDAKPFPETLAPSIFDNAVVARAYQVAREIPDVLVQQPCYCFCQGHGQESLLDCYTDYHGAG
jgi:hypothetical protein